MKEWWENNKDKVLLGLLAVYVFSLAVVTVDQVFGPWIFLPKMDREIRTRINELASSDATAQEEAFRDLVNMKGDFAVRALIKSLDNPKNPHAESLTFNALKTITGQSLGNDVERWKRWFEAHKSEFP